MLDVVLKFQSGGEEQTISVTDYRTTLGRGGDASHRFDDSGLSRINSSLYREGDQIWIVDDNSTNGTFVNGQKAAGSGSILKNGDIIKIGNSTSIRVEVKDPAKVVSPVSKPRGNVVMSDPHDKRFGLLPIALIGFAVLVIGVTAIFIGAQLLNNDDNRLVLNNENTDSDTTRSTESSPTPAPKSSPTSNSTGTNSSGLTNTEIPVSNDAPPIPAAPSKPYSAMTDDEKRNYVGDKAMRVAQIIGNSSSDTIPPAAINRIKADVDGYLRRLSKSPMGGGCRLGDNLQVTFERASKNSPFIVRAFNSKGIDPRIGLYLAMIESEHCNCLQSPTGPLGMYQFTYSTAMIHFEPNTGVVRGASPSAPDDRCKPEPAANAAASYMKALTGRYGTGPSSVPLAIGSYNSGEGGLSSNLVKALSSNQGLPRDFWSMIENGELLSKQFQAENFKYVPKFFAAAIIGENPTDFGLKLQPLSTYTK